MTLTHSSSTGNPRSTGSSTADGPLELVRSQTLGLLAKVARATLVMTLLGSLSVLVAPVALASRLGASLSLLLVVGVVAWLLRRLQAALRGELSAEALFTLPALFALAALGVSAHYFVGFFSGIPVIVLWGANFVAVARYLTRGQVTLSYGVLFAGYVLLWTSMIPGVLPDHGMVGHRPEHLVDQLVMLVGALAVMLAMFAISWGDAGSAFRLDAELTQAVLDASGQEQLLQQAKRELWNLTKVGGPGRYTGVSVEGYRLDVLLGRGGMGEVYAAKREADGTACAVKILRHELLSKPEAVRRFAREAEILSQLDSPSLVSIFEVGTRENALPFIAMERLDGLPLSARLRDEGRLDLDEASSLLRDLAGALDAAHGAGVIHRDIKPQNVFEARRDGGERRWVLLDFGVAKLAQSSGGQLTHTQVVGTPGYMAPEQVSSSRDADERSDVYGVAALMYRVLTGIPPFSSKKDARTMMETLERMPLDPHTVGQLPEDVIRWLRIGLEKDPERRFQTVVEMAALFELARTDRLPRALRAEAEALDRSLTWEPVADVPGGRLRPSVPPRGPRPTLGGGRRLSSRPEVHAESVSAMDSTRPSPSGRDA